MAVMSPFSARGKARPNAAPFAAVAGALEADARRDGGPVVGNRADLHSRPDLDSYQIWYTIRT